MNKKKLYLSLFSLMFLAVAVMGTVAYFSKSFSSNNNIAKAANFNIDVVNTEGKVIGDAQFNLDDNLFPGMDPVEAYNFVVNKNDTKVPVEYKVNLTRSGELFPADNSSPVKLTLQRKVDNKWVGFDGASAFSPESDVESFKILVSWPHGTNDIAFQGKTGTIKLEVVATQVDVAANEINGNLAKTTKGEAAVAGAKTIVSYKFDEAPAPKMNPFKFYIYDGDGYVNEWYGSGSQKVINGVVFPRTGAEVAEAIVKDFYVTQKGFFTPLTDKWDITNVGSEVIFTSKLDKAYDNFNIVLPASENRAEIKGEFLKKQAGTAGKAGVKQVNTLNIDGKVNKAGKLVVTFADGSVTVDKTINIAKGDTNAAIAGKIATAFSGLSDWNVTNAAGSADVVFTAKTTAADKNVTVTLGN